MGKKKVSDSRKRIIITRLKNSIKRLQYMIDSGESLLLKINDEVTTAKEETNKAIEILENKNE